MPQINRPGSLSARIGQGISHASTPSPTQCEILAGVSACLSYLDGALWRRRRPCRGHGTTLPVSEVGEDGEALNQTSKGGGIRLEYEDMPESGDGSGQNRGMAKALTMILNEKTNDTSLSRHHFSFLSDSAR